MELLTMWGQSMPNGLAIIAEDIITWLSESDTTIQITAMDALRSFESVLEYDEALENALLKK
jgi:hypothetical protein